jgi:hypothetical protein
MAALSGTSGISLLDTRRLGEMRTFIGTPAVPRFISNFQRPFHVRLQKFANFKEATRAICAIEDYLLHAAH